MIMLSSKIIQGCRYGGTGNRTVGVGYSYFDDMFDLDSKSVDS